MTDRSVNERNAMPFVTTTAGRVFCEERGSGVPVVLLHATLHDRRDFDPVAGPLATRYRTIAVDWPGHGRSDPPGGDGAVDAFRFAAQGRAADARRDTGIAIPGVRDRARRVRLGPGRIPGPGRAIHRVRDRGLALRTAG
jgi:pimeloyl-ACP methyl ester carboxylesterase